MAPFIIDHTTLSLYQNCPFKYYLSEILRLEKIVLDERDIDKLFGQMAHTSLELYYKGGTMQEMLSVWNTYEDLRNSKGELLNKTKTKDNGIRLIKEYLTHYQLQDNQQETLAVEVEDSFELAPNIIWKVKIDRIYKEQGNIYVQDHKAQPLESLILTPSGWVKMGSLKVGDFVIGSNGKSTKITGIFPQGQLDCYEITFWDGAKVKCSKDHLWFVKNQYHKDWQLLTLEEIIEERAKHIGKSKYNYNFQVPIPKPICFSTNKILPIHPYLLGVILGDGCITGHVIEISIGKQDEENMIENLRKILPNGLTIQKNKGNNFSWIIKCSDKVAGNSLIHKLKELKLMGRYSYNKFIPTEYLTSSIKDRLELLQGLLDTDGFVYKTSILFDSTSIELINGIIYLVRSLGGIARCWKRTGTIKQAYRVAIQLENFEIFKLKRKLNKIVPHIRKSSRYISSIEYIGREKMQCISVSAKDGLYITNDFILTHNTTSKIGYNYFAGFQLNQQVDGYTDYTIRKYGQCSGFVPNVLEVGWVDKPILLDIDDPMVEMYSIKGRKYSKYYGCEMAYCSGFNCRFQRDIVNRTKEEIQDFEQNSINWIGKLKQDTTWCKNKNMCGNFKGCDFKELCKTSIGIQLDEQIQEQLYKKKEEVVK